jgi:anti-sigma factor RsiW
MESCRRIRKKISAFQDGEVASTLKHAIESHLDACEDCRSQYEAFLRTEQMLRRLPDIEPDARSSQRIVNGIEQRRAPLWIRIPVNALRLLPTFAPMAGMAAAGMVLGMILSNLWMGRQLHPVRSLSVFSSEQAITLASTRTFDAVPPGSFAETYLNLTPYSQEGSHAK